MSNCPNTKKQHYISQFYLNYFSSDSSEESKEIWQYDKQKNRFFAFPVPIKSICYEENIYELRNDNGKIICPNAIEKSLGKIESEASKVFSSIKRKISIPQNGKTLCFLTSQEKIVLKQYMAVMVLRSEDVINSIQDEVKEFYGEKVTTNFARNKALNSCLPISENKSDATDLLKDVLSLFENMSFQVGTTNCNCILTSDSPIVFHGNNAKKLDEIFFPLFPNAILYLKPFERSPNDMKNRLTELADGDVKYFNEEIVKHSKRWVFANNKNALSVVKKMNLHRI